MKRLIVVPIFASQSLWSGEDGVGRSVWCISNGSGCLEGWSLLQGLLQCQPLSPLRGLKSIFLADLPREVPLFLLSKNQPSIYH